MSIPDFQTFMLPLLKLCADGNIHSLAEAVEKLGEAFNISPEDREVLLKSGQTRLYNRIGWSTSYLRKAGLIQSAGPGLFTITDAGKDALAKAPPVIDVAFLIREYPAAASFAWISRKAKAGEQESLYDASTNSWKVRPETLARIRAKVESSLPDPNVRRAVLSLLAFVIENADEERPGGWILRETRRGLRLLTGRLIACDLERSRVRIAVTGPLGDEDRDAIGSVAEDDDSFRSIPSGMLLTVAADRAQVALERLRERINSFVDAAMATIRQPVDLADHCPEAIEYLKGELERGLPQPVTEEPPVDDLEKSDDEDENHEPIVRGRAPIFELGNQSIQSLMDEIEADRIALPDLQRPFVWEDTKVRDLLDSLFVGFPVGTLVFWQTASERDARMVGSDKPSSRATTLVIDGQQRLTSLYAVIRGAEVVAQDGTRYRVQIAFRPRDGRFEVADAAIRNDPEFLLNITELWTSTRGKPQIRRDLLNRLRDAGRAISQDYEDAVERNLDRAHSIGEFRFPTVLIRRTATAQGADTTEEDVAEIFVRINNQGTRLRQSDFVLTLLSVFHGELRDRIEARSKSISNGRSISMDSQQLLRAACALAFGRARMLAIYRFLRGVDPVTGDAEPADRERRLQELDQAANECLDPTTWSDYLIRVGRAGFVSEKLVSSKSAIVNAYALYCRGLRIGVPKAQLGKIISRWIFGTLLTARYSTSSETVFERDLARLSSFRPGEGEAFVDALDRVLSEQLTGDFWTHTLPALLDTPRSTSPAALAFRASQIVLGSCALFSDVTIQQLVDPSVDGGRSAMESHHLFPAAWLKKGGVEDKRLVNQVANLADVGWHENSVASSRPPSEYVPRLRAELGLGEEQWGRSLAEHALPPSWETMRYEDFLRERRARMAEIIRVAYRKLGGEAGAPPLNPPWFLPGAEQVWKEIGQAERALRQAVRDVYTEKFARDAATKIEERLSDQDREVLARAMRSRPSGVDPLTVIDYLYIAQLIPLLSIGDVWEVSRSRFGWDKDSKAVLNRAVADVASVRNEIAHVREVERDRLLRASLAASQLIKMTTPQS